MTRKSLIALALIFVMVGPALACQGTGTQSATDASATGVPILGAGETAIPEAGPTDTSAAGGVPVLGGNSAQPAFQSVDVEAQPIRIVQVLNEIISPRDNLHIGLRDGMLLLVENPNPDLAIAGTECRLTGYDSSGAVTETSSFCDIGVLFPGERRTMYEYIFNRGSTSPARLEIEITKQGEPVKTSLTGTELSVERVRYQDGKVTGVVKNDTEYVIRDSMFFPSLLTAALYDDQGNVICIDNASFGIDFIPPRDEAAFEITIVGEFHPARVEVFIVLADVNQVLPAAAIHQPIQVGRVLRFIDAQDNTAQFFFYATNPNSDRSIDQPEFQVAAYDAQGFVLGTSRSSALTPVIFPGEQTIMVTPDFIIPQGSTIDHFDVQVFPFVTASQLLDYHAVGLEKNPLSMENCRYQQTDGSILCILKNTWKNPIPAASAIVVGFDSDGNPTHLSYCDINDVPADGQIDVTFTKMWAPVNDGAAPVRFEAYANAVGEIP